jgi:hypothetical protein
MNKFFMNNHQPIDHLHISDFDSNVIH